MILFKSCNIFYKIATQICGIKPYKQKPNFCGAACLHIIMKFYGLNISENKLAKLSKSSKKNGANANELLNAAKKLNFNGFYSDNCSTADIKKYLKKGYPVIVEWFSTNTGHFSVIFKIDNKYIYMQDPEIGNVRKLKIEEFAKIWFSFSDPKRTKLIKQRLLVIYPKDK